jgi:hypothetical protein
VLNWLSAVHLETALDGKVLKLKGVAKMTTLL